MFIRSDKRDYEIIEEGIKRKVLSYSHELMAVEVSFKSGAVGTLHNHRHSQVSYILTGSFEVQIEEKKTILNKGDTFYVEPNKIHGVVAMENSVILDVFSPMREDFL